MINNRGSASVFLIFLFAILAGAIGILLEGSRYRAFQVCTNSMTDISEKAVLSEYYRPLYDDYHVFFLAFAQGEDKEQYIQTRVKQYADYTLNPVKGRTVIDKSMYGKAFHIPDKYEVKVTELDTAIEQEGKCFEEEAISYIRYKSLTMLAQKLRGTVESVNKVRSSTRVMGEKMKCEEVLSKSTQGTLKLMELVDGVSLDDSGKVRVNDSFIKQFMPEKISMNSVGVNNTELWIKLKNRYTDVNHLLQVMKAEAKRVDSLLEEMSNLEEERCALSGIEKEVVEELDEQIDELGEEISAGVNNIKKDISRFKHLIKMVNEKTAKAIEVTEELKHSTQEAQIQLKKYQTYLESNASDIEGDLRASLETDAKELEAVTATGLNVGEISDLLNRNREVLQRFYPLREENVYASHGVMQNIIEEADCNLHLLEEYSIRSITFSYGSSKKGDVENPIKKIKELIGTSITDLVMPENTEISDKEISQEMIAGTISPAEKENGLKQTLLHIQELQGVGDLFSAVGSGENISLKEVDSLTSRVLFLFYQKEHFNSFLESESKSEKERSLDYELEYILQGKGKDKENLQEVVEQELAYKTVLNFISIFTDSQKRQLAKETAIALAGITGIEPLIHVTEIAILLVWAFDESLVDVAGLLQEKECQIMKRGSEFQINYNELLLINRDMIQKKAGGLAGKKEGGITYQTFVQIMLLIKGGTASRLRTMEMINQNMVLRNKVNFSFENCVYSFKVRAKSEMKSRFLFFQFGKGVIEKRNQIWRYQTELEQSY